MRGEYAPRRLFAAQAFALEAADGLARLVPARATGALCYTYALQTIPAC